MAEKLVGKEIYDPHMEIKSLGMGCTSFSDEDRALLFQTASLLNDVGH